MKWKKVKVIINWIYKYGFLDFGGVFWFFFYIVVRQGYLDCVKLFISVGAIVNSVNVGKYIFLYEVVYRGYDDIILEFFFRGVDLYVVSNQKRILFYEVCI